MQVGLFFILATCLFGLSSEYDLPENWPRCKVSPSTELKSNKCLENALNIALKDLANPDGVISRALGVPISDPLRIDKIEVGQSNPNSPVRVTMEFQNFDLIGLGSYEVKHFSVKADFPNNFQIKTEGFMKKMQMIGDYTTEGNVLILPVVGNGKCQVQYDNVKSVGMWSGGFEIIDGKEHIKLNNYSLALDITKFSVNLENLFNGNKLLSDNMNRILNENWEIVYNELKPSMENALANKIAMYYKKILEKIPFKDIFTVE